MNNLLTQKFAIAAIALLFVLSMSCSHEPAADEPEKPGSSNVHEWEDSTINGDATMTRMLFSVGDSINVVRQGQTRATTTIAGATTFQANDIVTIGVSDKSPKDYKVTNTTSGALAYNGTATDAYFWQNSSETVSLRAWSYGNTTTNSGDPDNAVYTLPTDQSSNYGELLYKPATNYDYASYKTGIPITLYHQLARLVINLEHIKTGDLNVSEIYIGDGSTATIPTTAKFHKPSTGNIGTWDNIGTEKGKITPKTETANACYSAVLIPDTYAANQKFIVIKTSDNRTYCYTPSSPIVLTAGNQYNYTISVKDLKEVSTLTIGAISAYTYDGTAKEPHPTVTDGSKTLTEGTDYTLFYSNNTNAGTATVTVTGKGGYYNGTQSKNFTINKATGTITLSNTALAVGKGKNGTFTATLSPYESGATVSAASGNTSNYTASAGAINSSGVSTVTISGVASCTTKNCTVSATSSNYTYSNKTAGIRVYPVADMIDVTFNSNGSITDSGGFLTWTKYGSPTVSNNSTYKRNEVTISNTSATSLSQAYYSSTYSSSAFKTKIENGFSQEVFFKPSNVSSRQTIFGSLEGGGHAILISSSGKIEITSNITGGTSWESNTTLTANTYYHVVFIWDQGAGKMYLYINGALDKTVTTSGDYVYPKELRYTIGADLADGGTPPLETNAKCYKGKILIARLYGPVLSATDVSALYSVASNP